MIITGISLLDLKMTCIDVVCGNIISTPAKRDPECSANSADADVWVGTPSTRHDSKTESTRARMKVCARLH